MNCDAFYKEEIMTAGYKENTTKDCNKTSESSQFPYSLWVGAWPRVGEDTIYRLQRVDITPTNPSMSFYSLQDIL